MYHFLEILKEIKYGKTIYKHCFYFTGRKSPYLIFHRKLKKWLPPGGHIDPNEMPSETAIREAFEETGLEIELIFKKTSGLSVLMR